MSSFRFGTPRLSSIADYDSIAFGLQASNLRTEFQVQDELRSICEYACIRKETSKAGSVLLLRFFHGYYQSETGQVLRTNRNNVDNLLALARRETKLFHGNPGGLIFMRTKNSSLTPIHKPDGASLLDELRARIFHSREGDCYSVEQLASSHAPSSVSVKAIASTASETGSSLPSEVLKRGQQKLNPSLPLRGLLFRT